MSKPPPLMTSPGSPGGLSPTRAHVAHPGAGRLHARRWLSATRDY